MAELVEQARLMIRSKDIIKYLEFKPHLSPILIDPKIFGVFFQIFVIGDHRRTLNRVGPSGLYTGSYTLLGCVVG